MKKSERYQQIENLIKILSAAFAFC